MVILLVVFIWLKVGDVLDLSWWWMLLAVVLCLLDSFLTGVFKGLQEARKQSEVLRYLRRLR